MTNKRRIGWKALLCGMLAASLLPVAVADDGGTQAGDQSAPLATAVHGKVDFVYRNRVLRTKEVSYYPNVYAYDRREYAMMPFDAAVPARFFVVDDQGDYALAPVLLDVLDTVRIALYGEDVGKAARAFGQYTEKTRSYDKEWGYSGIHEGIDYIAEEGHPIYAVVAGEVIRAGGDKDGTVAIYNELYNTTVLYLHVRNVDVKLGKKIAAGTQLGTEGDKGASDPFTHVEVRFGRHVSPSPYRNAILESDLPYDFFIRALSITPTDRDPVTAASVLQAEKDRLLAEEKARAEREAAEREAWLLANPTPIPTQVPELLEELDEDVPGDVGFAEETPAPTSAPAPAG